MRKNILFISILLLSAALYAAPAKLIMLRDNGPLRKANNSNGVEWDTTVRAGTELELTTTDLVIKDLVTSSKTYKDVKFYEVKYKKNTYYVQESDAEVAAAAAVIQSDTVLFTRPTLSSFRNAVLETGTLVVAGDAYTEFNKTFCKVVFYDTIDGLKRTRYVNKNDISYSDKDVKAVMLLENARTTENEDLKNELLNNAKSMKTSILIEAYITKEIAGILKISDFSDDAIETISAQGHMYTEDGSKVNVRDKPGRSGSVIGQIETAEQPWVTALMRTGTTEEIDGKTDYWYYIKDDASDLEGWVFGAYVLFP